MPHRFLLIALAILTFVAFPTAPAGAAYCTSGTELTQDFPTTGTPVSRWHLCWEILRMPNGVGALVESETLV